jgi:hypothetical protein
MQDKWLGTPAHVIIPRLQSLLRDLEMIADSKAIEALDDAVVIRNCMLVQRSVPCLIGEMSGHPHIKEGTPGVTSELFYLDQKRRIGRTLSRWYRFDQGLIG